VSDTIKTVGIVGCGTMGGGIAQIIASHGYEVRFIEMNDAAVERGSARIGATLDRLVSRGKIEQSHADVTFARITGSTDYSTLSDADLIIEAVPEDLALKQDAFRKIDAVAREDAIIATNTSSLPVMDMAVHTKRPNRVLGFHFFNPAPVMELIELVRTVVTDESVVTQAKAFAASIGKTPVTAGDRRGFIANHLLFPYLNQAVGMVETGYATADDIDAAMRFGAGLPMGPIALTDLVGLDTFVGIMDAVHEQFSDTRFAPKPILNQLISAGFTGRKAGRGFYTYQEPGSSRPLPSPDGKTPVDVDRISGWTTIGVIGTGTMASGIAEVCAKAGFDVVVRGRSKEKAEAVAAAAGKSMARMVSKGRMTEEEMVATVARIKPTHDLQDLADCNLIIEAIAEDLEIKRGLFSELTPMLREDCIITSTTSSLPVIECAMASGRPDKFIGLHFFNPAAIMKLVEIVPTVRTEADVTEDSRAFVEKIQKVAVHCPDRAGFIVNALLFPYLNDAVKMLASHYATAEEIDTAMRLGCGYPVGPFQLMDIVGLDVTLKIVETLHHEFREPSYEAADLLRHMVDAGFLGRKAGRGFYVY
jgi:3-hydroxybutyryl-CoA dehydrogenase